MTNKLTYRDHFAEVLSHLTHGECPDWLIDEWLNGESDNLQSWVVDHKVSDWAMGITIIEACQILAQAYFEECIFQCVEVDHEG